MFFLAADEAAKTAGKGGITNWILPIVLVVLVIGIFLLNYFRSKKNRNQMQNMVDSLKVGDKVKTYSGMYGTILEIVETTDGKVAVLETGSEKNKGIFSIDINAIYAIDEKKPVVYDANGNIVEENQEEVAAVEEVKTEEVAAEEKPKQEKKKGSKKQQKEEAAEQPKEDAAEQPKEDVAEEKVEEKPE